MIAHSFGTFVIGWLLRKRFDLKFNRIIFCGSVLPFRFPFQYLSGQFFTLVNEVGTKDIWPILAEMVTWGYGSTGAFGFHRPGIFDRYHKGSHSAFLNADFCRRWWVPILKDNLIEGGGKPEPPTWWLRLLDVMHIKYLALVLAAILVWTNIPERKFMVANIALVCRQAAGVTNASSEEKLQPAIGPPTGQKRHAASHLMVIVSSDSDKYIQAIVKFLDNKVDFIHS